MNDLYNEIEELKAVIDRYVGLLIGYQNVDIMTVLGPLMDRLSVTLPKIVECYDRPEMAEYKEDQQYWPGQLTRLIDALSGGDRFMSIDVLKFETSANLTEFQRIIKEKGLA